MLLVIIMYHLSVKKGAYATAVIRRAVAAAVRGSGSCSEDSGSYSEGSGSCSEGK